MNKLDEIYDKLGIHQGHKMPDTADEFRKVLSSEIKTLFLELIDRSEKAPTTNKLGYLRQKVEKL